MKKLEDLAKQRGAEVDINVPLAAALERLIAAAEKELSPPAEPKQQTPEIPEPELVSGDPYRSM